ncbi:MAG: DUF1659 domain-containing protein [Selenomonas sp.]|jgi:hypothetical protein|nr:MULTISPECIES: DUF1659 domain-containing protein [Selenomonas]MCR5757110.1 DUF1659 domain-containing protein [Selenomonas sp.]SEA00912.1 Protein of unknown function [Selenomonas ruminantium]SFB13063.1 Protein of unknown function [Selenomonas ruminantium]SFW30619.1 Protein of unknown function [Selenomonas ruminantium]
MAVRNNEVTRLNLKVITGSDENGKDTIATRGFTVNPELDDDTILSIGKKLGNLQSFPVEAIARQDSASLAAEH